VPLRLVPDCTMFTPIEPAPPTESVLVPRYVPPSVAVEVVGVEVAGVAEPPPPPPPQPARSTSARNRPNDEVRIEKHPLLVVGHTSDPALAQGVAAWVRLDLQSRPREGWLCRLPSEAWGMRSYRSLGRLCRDSALTALLVIFGHAAAYAQSPAPVASSPSAFGSSSGSAFPPVAIQGCAAKVTGNGSIAFPHRVNFDLSFLNISGKTANAVMLTIGGTDFVKAGVFAPNSATSWRIDARSFGAFQAQNCAVKAVRFTDGTEWDAPNAVLVSPAAGAPPNPSPSP